MSHLTPQDFTMTSGDDKVVSVAITDDGTPTGAPVDLTGLKSAIWKVARNDRSAAVIYKSLDPDALAGLAPPGGIEVVNEVGGIVEITLDSDDTKDLVHDYYHELQIQDAADRRRTVMVGTITVDRDLVED